MTVRLNLQGLYTPQTFAATTAPLTRETIDLTFEGDGSIKNKSSRSPENIFAGSAGSVTIRKRTRTVEPHEDTPCRPPGPKFECQGISLPRSGATQILNPEHPNLPTRDHSATQVPDSEGDEEFDHFDDDFHSDDIPLEAKQLMGIAGADIVDSSTLRIQEPNIVPESPTPPPATDRSSRIYPSLTSRDFVLNEWRPPVVMPPQTLAHMVVEHHESSREDIRIERLQYKYY